MNKKIIAIAIASALAAPAAMADLTISGAFVGELVSRNKESAVTVTNLQENAADATMAFKDGGKNAINFMATSGNSYGKLGLDVGPGAGQTAGGAGTLKYRDFFICHKFGDSSVQFGTMAGAVKNLEKDMFIATFLQTRKTYAEAATATNFGSSSYISNVIQYKGKVGPGTLIAQYDPTSKVPPSTNAGPAGISFSAKSGGINWYVGYNNGVGNDTSGTTHSNMKVGGNMKFGAVKLGLNYSAAKTDVSGTTTNWSAAAVDATMDMGNNMSLNANIGVTSGDKEGTSMRLAVMKNIDKNTFIYGGYTSTDPKKPTDSDAQTKLGLGMGIKF